MDQGNQIKVPISTRERIYLRIRDDITYGRLFPGERLVESKLVEELKVSRGPIREALRQLESEGLIKFESNKGVSVRKHSVSEIEQIYNLRFVIESYAARLCAEKATKDDIAYLRKLHEILKIAAGKSDYHSWIYNNKLFHEFFSENCGNIYLHQILSSLKRMVPQYFYSVVRIPGHFNTYIEQHESILRSMVRKDGKMAAKYTGLHIKTFKEVLIEWLSLTEDAFKREMTVHM
jgi:DNA-binding GntR family transcriptional regulator